MPKKISRYAQGLNKLTGLVGAEATPYELGDQLVPVVDATPFYGYTQLRDQSAAAAGGIGTVAILEVPDNQNWLAFHLGAQWTSDATVSFVALSMSVQGVPIEWRTFSAQWTGAGRILHMPLVLPYPRLLRARDIVSVRLEDLAGSASLTFQVNASFGLLG